MWLGRDGSGNRRNYSGPKRRLLPPWVDKWGPIVTIIGILLFAVFVLLGPAFIK